MDFKVVVLGASCVGKTCLLDRYVNDQFESAPKNTIGAAFAAKKVGGTCTLAQLRQPHA